MDCLSGWYFRMTCEKRCLKCLEGFQRVKHLARLFVRTKTQVNECFSVVFHKDAILEISPVQGSEFLHHPANMLLVLCRVCRLHDIPIGGNDHLESSSFCSRGKSCPMQAIIPSLRARHQTFGTACSPRKMAAFRLANSSKLVGRHPNSVWLMGETCDSLPLRRSPKSSSSASTVYEGIPAARLALIA